MPSQIRDRVRGTRAPGSPFASIGILAGLRAATVLVVAAADQMHELLRRRDIAAKFAALLRHRAAHACGLRRASSLMPGLHERIDPRFGAVTCRQLFNRRLACFAGRRCTANIDVAMTHDGCPLLMKGLNARARAKLRRRLKDVAGGWPRFSLTDRNAGPFWSVG